MFEFLIHISGPVYLQVYAGGALLLLVLAWMWSLDNSLSFKEPSPSKYDALTIATLIGLPHVIRTILFRLWSRNMVRFEGDDDSPQVVATAGPEQGETPIEIRLLKFLEQPHNPLVLFTDPNLKRDIEKEIAPIEKKLIHSHLRLDKDTKSRKVKIAWMVALVLLSAGILKLVYGVSRSKPVGFLILEMIVALILMFVMLKPWRTTTRLGNRYLKGLKKHFNWIKGSMEVGRVPNGVDPALPLAIFGIGMFSSVPAFKAFQERFNRSSSNSSTGCGGCGGSDGGGSDGGGGCGGCGGCGG